MPSIDDGNNAVGTGTSYNNVTGKYEGEKTTGMGEYKTTGGGTGAYYPVGNYQGLTGPNAFTMAGGPTSVIGGMLFSAGKVLWNQTQYGMNTAVKDNYLEILNNPNNADLTPKQMVNAAREKYHVDNAKKGIDSRGDSRNGDTGGVESPAGSGNWVSTDDNKIKKGAGGGGGGTFTVNPETGEVEEGEEAVKLGELKISEVDPNAERPAWAPPLLNNTGGMLTGGDNDYVRDPYGIKMDQEFLGMEEWQRREDAKNAVAQPTLTGIPATVLPQDNFLPTARTTNVAAPRTFTGAAAPIEMSSAPLERAQALAAQTPMTTPEYDTLQRMLTSTQAPVAAATQLQAPVAATGAAIPRGAPESGTFRPVTFRSGTGTSTTNADGTTTSLNDPYSGLSSLVGSGQGLLGQAAANAQQDPNQLNFDMNTDQRAQALFDQRSALLEPAFAQQRALAQQDMFGSGRLGLRLAGQGVGAGSGMVQPDAFGMNQAQAQALSGLAARSTDDAFAQAQAMAALESQRFGQNQQAQQQQYANLVGSGEGMLSAGIQGAQLEAAIAQQQLQNQQSQQAQGLSQQRLALDTQAQQQNYGLASRGQSQDYGLNQAQFNLASQGQQQNFGLAQTGQQQDYGLAQQQFGLSERGQEQNFGLNAGRLAMDQQGQQQNFGLAQRGQDLAELSNRQGYGLNLRGQDLAELANSQNFGLANRSADLAELSQSQNFGLAQLGQQQNYGLAQQGQQQNYGLAQQQQLQDYEMGMLTGNRNYGLQRDIAAQDYELATEQNRISLITGQALANKNNYQPNDLLNIFGGGLAAYAGTTGGAASIGSLFGLGS